MTCNICETNFQDSQTLVVSVEKSGTRALLYVRNQGRNIVQINRILLCVEYAGGGATIMYLRPPPGSLSWLHPSASLEPGWTVLFYILNGVPIRSIVQAQAEYIEIEGRSRSCPATFQIVPPVTG
jgi:hypothetical protein